MLHILTGHSEQASSVARAGDGNRAVSGSNDCSICVWNLRTGTLERTLKQHTGPVNAVALSADGCYALSGSSDRTVKLWDVNKGACLRTLAGHKAIVTAVGLAKNGERAISGSSDSEVILWNAHKGNMLAQLSGCHSDAINAVIINEAGAQAATGSDLDCQTLAHRRSSSSGSEQCSCCRSSVARIQPRRPLVRIGQ